jgi:Zn finger protein HypA/HybF involved in hydrogenase expression
MNAVLTCEEYPQILDVNKMREENLEHLCNKWEKNSTNNNNNKFTLSYKYKKIICNCDNSEYTNLDDFSDYECYNCGSHKSITEYEDGTDLYLQNSGSIDIVCTKPKSIYSIKLIELETHPNIYKWINLNNNYIFALHIEDNMLSDSNIIEKIQNNENVDTCYITFTETIET